MRTKRSVGRQGELLAASILEAHGIRTCHVDIEGDDLWAKTPSDVFFRVQVKSASCAILQSPHHTIPKYNFTVRGNIGYTGLFMLVALDVRFAIIRLGTTVTGPSIKVKKEHFTEMAEKLSITEAFKL